METATHLKVNDVHLHFGGLTALQGVSFDVGRGQLFGLVGPNGAGKTAVLNVISGLYKPQSGSVMFEDLRIDGLQCHKVAPLGIGRTFQNLELFGRMTVLENVLLGCHWMMHTNLLSVAHYWGMARKEEVSMRERVEEVIDFLELWRFRKQTVMSLPYGVQKMVGLARALVSQPRIILLDEPSSGMNRQEKEDLARFILRVKHELGTTMLWVEHDMKLIGDLSDRIAVLNCGLKIAEGSPREVVANPDVESAFLGTFTRT